ncbi:MAG: TatD family hydrolase [Dehalococcoidia bacterium]
MRYIDPHLHTILLDDGVMMKIALTGMEACVIPMLHSMNGIFEADAVLTLWERSLDFELKRGSAIGYEAFVSLGVPFYGLTEKGAEECLKRLPDYLKNDRVVAMGEIGLDVGTAYEERLFRTQLQIAKSHNLPVICHTPIRLAPQGPEIIKQVIKVIKEERFPMDRVILDHAGERTFDPIMASGAKVGLSVCYDKMPPESAATLVLNNRDKLERFIINSEVASGDGYFTVPMVALALRRAKLPYKDIYKIIYENPRAFFNLPLD